MSKHNHDYVHSNIVNEEKRKILIWVLMINSVMFFSQFIAGWVARSTSLLADSLDMFADAFAFAVSLYALNRGPRWLAKATFIKGCLIGVLAIVILAEMFYKLLFTQAAPHVGIMIIFSILGLIANASCFYLLYSHRHRDINMHSTWICARNDMLGNLAVLLSVALVTLIHSRWPDLVIRAIMAIILLKSSGNVLKAAGKQLIKT